jgi:putative ABC transport system permease protein
MFTDMQQYGQSGGPDLSLMQAAVYATVGMIFAIFILTVFACFTLPIFFGAMASLSVGLRVMQNLPDPVGKFSKIGGLVFRSLRRNLLRTALTYVALFVLTGMLTFIYGIVKSIGKMTSEKEDQQLVIMTDKFGIPSQLRPGYADKLKDVIRKMPESAQPRPLSDAERAKKGVPASPLGSIKPEELDRLFSDSLTKDESSPDRRRFRALAEEGLKENFMTWSFVMTSLDPTKFTQENNLFLFALDPTALKSGMMSEQGLSKEDLGDEGWDEMLRTIDLVKLDKRHIIIGEDRLKLINKKVGDEVKLYSINYKDITFECKIVGAFPSGSRMGNNAMMQYDYLQAKLSDYERTKGTAHPQADRCLNIVWVRMPNKPSYQALASKVNDPSNFNGPATKMETFSALIGSFLEPYKDIFWGMKYIIMPAIIVIMCLVIGITITIGVRERWTEMAVMKVLGFQPWQIMGMIVSEAMLIGLFGGMLSTWFIYFLPLLIRYGLRTVGMKSAFFETFSMPWEILLYGPILGIVVGIIGSALPSWNARKVKVSEVFAQVA